MELSKIWEGYKNLLIPSEELKVAIIKAQEERLSICKDCPMNSSKGEIKKLSKCKECGCFLKAKAASLSSECPLGKWLAAVDNETAIEITLREKIINKKN